MSKTPNKTSYYVSLKSGEGVKVCCGPAILALEDAVESYMALHEEKIQCQNRDDAQIKNCPVRAMRAEAKKKTEKRISKLRAQAANLSDEADRLEKGLNN